MPEIKNHAPTALVALAMLAACSGGNSQMAPTLVGPTPSSSQSVQGHVFQNGRLDSILALRRASDSAHRVTTPSFFDPRAKGKPLIFLADVANGVVNIYRQADKNHMVGQVTGLHSPGALAADASRDLYIGESQPKTGIFDVLVYAPPYTGMPKLTLDDANYETGDISVSRKGVVAVANVCSINASFNCNPNSGNVTLYPKNSNKACATVAAPATFSNVVSSAFSDDGTLYITGDYVQSSNFFFTVGEVKGGCNAKKITLLAKSTTIFYLSIRINKADQIAILDYGNGNASNPPVIYTYNQPKRGSLGNPVSSTPLQPGSQFDFKFLASGSDLYTAGYINSVQGGFEYDYPAGGVPENTITMAGVLSSVAVTPPLLP